ncbi:MAG: RNA polymerase factor sigma-54 [Deltaproteobacteria bacterium]|nr:RNA polymerase factor sigma-54 [Deltaproteobacteria bacterium]
MALDLRLQQKMVQQLVMTPQLQQAIKLLQLSHLEMADVLQAELEQNPVLEEPADGGDDPPTEGGVTTAETEAAAESDGLMGLGSTPEADSPSPSDPAPADPVSTDPAEQAQIATDISVVLTDAPAGSTPEPSSTEVDREIDWEAYLETYSYSLPASAGSRGDEELPPFEANLTKATSLHDHLRWQVQMGDFSSEESRIAAMLIEEISDDGYLSKDAANLVAEELDVSVDEVELVIRDLQGFDPTGVAARDLRECLLLQVKHLTHENPLVVTIIDKHLHHVERRNLNAIARELKVTVEEVGEAVKLISQLEPRPGRIFNDREPQYITPDIYVYKVGDDYAIVLNEDGLPKLRISNYYRNALSRSGGNAKSFIQDKLRSAVWLIRSIHMRQRTIYRVMESILKFQRDFFDKGSTALKPLILKDVAEDVGMHESTISRVTTNKYVHTPQGIYELKYFFNSSINRVNGDSIASESVRNHIEKLIAEESAAAPLSDQQIVEHLKKQNIDIARRTVAKYREMLRIPSSSKRKKLF